MVKCRRPAMQWMQTAVLSVISIELLQFTPIQRSLPWTASPAFALEAAQLNNQLSNLTDTLCVFSPVH